MSHNNKTILVTGATGQQGGATARHLLRQGWHIRALTRSPDSAAARALEGNGAEVVKGDLDDRSSLDAAIAGAYGVFSFPNLALGIEVEVIQGRCVADAASAAGVQHFVQGSVGGVERDSGVPHFESKWEIEAYVRDLGLPATFLRPVFFMENFNWKREQILNGSYESMGLQAGRSLQLIAADDIGGFAALAFSDPQEFIGHSLEIAGDELSEEKIVETLTKVIGRSVQMVPATGPAPNEDMAAMFEWFNEAGYEADISALRRMYPGLKTFVSWLRETGW